MSSSHSAPSVKSDDAKDAIPLLRYIFKIKVLWNFLVDRNRKGTKYNVHKPAYCQGSTIIYKTIVRF